MKTYLLIFLISIPGCFTVKLPKPPGAFHLIEHQNVGQVGVLDAIDERKNEAVGAVGGAIIKVKKEELMQLATNYLVRYINEKAGLNVVRITMGASDPVEVIAASHKVDGLVILKIKELKMSSVKAAQIAQTDLILELNVFDAVGKQIYNRTVASHDERKEILIAEKHAGEMVEAVVKNALKELVKDPELKKIIARFRYGAISTFMRIPFLG